VAKRTHRGHVVYDVTQDRHSPEGSIGAC